MRVLYLNHVSQISGAENSLLTMVEGARRTGIVPHAVVPGPGPLADHFDSLGIATDWAPLGRLRRTRNPFRLLGTLLRLERFARRWETILRRHPAEIIHSNSTTAHVFAAYACHRAGAKLIWHVRDLVSLGRYAPWLDVRAHAIVAISQAVAERVIEDGADPRKVTVIHPGVQPPETTGRREAVRRELGAGDGHFVFGMVGQMVPWKGHQDFLDAASVVCRRQDQARFAIVGDDLFDDHAGLKADIHRRALAEPLRDRAVCTGHRSDIGDVIEALDCLVLPSHGEPFGRVVVEAMLLGKPVIATEAGGPREILDHGATGLLVPVGQPATLAETMSRLAADPGLCHQLGKAGQEHAAMHFTPKHNARQTVQLYQSLVG